MRRTRFLLIYAIVLGLSFPVGAANRFACPDVAGGHPAVTDPGNDQATAVASPHDLHHRAANSGDAHAFGDTECDCCGALCGMSECTPTTPAVDSASPCFASGFVKMSRSPEHAHAGEIAPDLFRPPIA